MMLTIFIFVSKSRSSIYIRRRRAVIHFFAKEVLEIYKLLDGWMDGWMDEWMFFCRSSRSASLWIGVSIPKIIPNYI